MRRAATVLALGLVAGAAGAQQECRTDPQDRDLAFAVGPRGDTLEFHGRNPARGLGRVCTLTLDCTLREPPALVDYFMVPQRAGDPPAVWNIRRVQMTFADRSARECRVTATSEPRPPLAEPPPFVRGSRKQ
jgi:hypothetical protein